MYQSGDIKAKLQRIIDYLVAQSYSEYMQGTFYRKGASYPTIGQWFLSIGEARTILRDAIKSFDSPTVEVIVVDLDALERRAIAAAIPDSDVISLLPYQAAIGIGDHHFHIVNKSAYNVTTNAHVIPYNETLCARGINTGKTRRGFDVIGVGTYATIPTCPGCLAKAKNQIAYHLQQKAQAGELR